MSKKTPSTSKPAAKLDRKAPAKKTSDLKDLPTRDDVKGGGRSYQHNESLVG